MSNAIQQLHGIVQQYQWGKMGSSSMVAKLCKSGDKKCKVEEDQPYAELWMGTHVKAPSKLVKSDLDLREFVKENVSVLGDKVSGRFNDLPYLFKVLSVAKALSIQAHPDKNHAEKLHAERPDIYKDPNHKPEMAIALTRFEALCGFRSVVEIVRFFQLVPELCTVIGEKPCQALKTSNDPDEQSAALKACFSQLIVCDKALLQEQLTTLVKRVSVMKGHEYDQILGELILRLNRQFPGDVGCFVIYFLNHVFLQPGEALFLKANVPHAYLDGDCIECMACSDNVVRAGLTPKLIDANTLIEMLEYQPSSVEEQLFEPTPTQHNNELLYNPPIDDFAVSCVKLPASLSSYEFSVNDSASIVLFIEGAAHVEGGSEIEVRRGTILFVPAGTVLQLSNIGRNITAYRATCLL